MIRLIASVSMPFIPPFSFEKTYKAFARSTAVAAVGAAGPLGAAMLRPPASAAGTSERQCRGVQAECRAQGIKHTDGTAYEHETGHRHAAWSRGSQR